jgi:hypothetical protein
MELPPNLSVHKYQTEYQLESAGNLPIPAKMPVNRWDATLDFQEVGVVEVDTCREEEEGLAMVGEEEGMPLGGTIGQ